MAGPANAHCDILAQTAARCWDNYAEFVRRVVTGQRLASLGLSRAEPWGASARVAPSIPAGASAPGGFVLVAALAMCKGEQDSVYAEALAAREGLRLVLALGLATTTISPSGLSAHA